MPVLADCGARLQLPPIPKASSLIAALAGTSQEHRVGAALFRQAHYAFQLQKMMRFTDPTLIRILHTMRTVGGQALSNSDWQALLSTEHADEHGRDQPDVTGWYHTCYVWSIIFMAAFVVAKESAHMAHKPLFYIQAVDVPQNLSAPDRKL